MSETWMRYKVREHSDVVFVHELQTVDEEAEFIGFEVFLLLLAAEVKLFLNEA